jgi:formamidopyrimidine-DNA glycosylase
VPELPEVETIVRDLQPLLLERRLSLVVRPSDLSLRTPWAPEWDQQLAGQVVRGLRRRGKWIVMELDGELRLVFHLGMTGQLTVVPASAPVEPHTHFIFPLADGPPEEETRQLRFRDTRRFGSATLFASLTALAAFFDEAGLGPEPFELDAESWRQRLAGTSRNLKAVLLDQSVVAGVGNIYSDEILFQARLRPDRTARDLTRAEADRLRRSVAAVLRRAIEKRGSSIRDYIGGSGLRGGYQDEFRVYGRSGEPCRRCRTLIEVTRLGGRSTHYCPQCQPGSDEPTEAPPG